ncbi:hypothetical protein NHH03_22315 [Stieleria sp. TO1_6]|uniref:hypothetical protein n=1 Tax=Stieleria tagensis TaxID=2956795 RepID=UPI00209B5CE6|nr:hypothetical protein [Stieleria tagensis]MCO8124491.1 hypothetical protein [Stieleria tagensis]
MPKPTRKKSFFKRIVISCLAVLVFVCIAVAYVRWQAAQALAAQLEPLRSAGKPLTILELQPPAVADDQNAFAALQGRQDALQQYESLLAQSTNNIEDESELRAAKISVAREMSKKFPNLVDQLRESASLTHYQLPLDYNVSPTAFQSQLLPHLGQPRLIARVLYNHALMSLADGKPDDAARDAIAINQWSRHVGNQPLLVSGLVGLAVRGIAAELAAEVLYAGGSEMELRQQMINQIGDESGLLSGYIKTLDGERAFGIASYQAIDSLLRRGQRMMEDQQQYLAAIENFQTLAGEPSGIAPHSTRPPLGMAALVVPALESSLSAVRSQQARSRALQILAAWQDQGGEQDQDVLQMGLPPAITTDPFNGESMKTRPINETISVYSVGNDGVDDGGNVIDGVDVGITAPPK